MNSVQSQDTMHYSWDIDSTADGPWGISQADSLGNYYVHGTTLSYFYFTPSISKINSQGNIVFTRVYKSFAVDGWKQNDCIYPGGIAIVGHPVVLDSIKGDTLERNIKDSISLTLFNDQGEIQAQYNYDNFLNTESDIYVRSVLFVDNSFYINYYYELSGYENDIGILQVDTSGQVINHDLINININRARRTNLFEFKYSDLSNTFFVVGRTSLGSTGNTTSWISSIVEFNKEREVVWQYHTFEDSMFTGFVPTMNLNDEGEVILFNTRETSRAEDLSWDGITLTQFPVQLFKFSKDRELLWKKEYLSDNMYRVVDMEYASTDKIYLIGSTILQYEFVNGDTITHNDRAFLMCFSENGEIEWVHNFINTNDNAREFGYSLNLYEIRELSNGNLAVVGNSVDEAQTGFPTRNHWIGIFTPDGCLMNSCGTEILYTQEEHAERIGDVSLYPNPVRRGNNVKVEWDKLTDVSTVEVYNFQGQKVHAGSLSQFQELYEIKTESLNPGMYYCVVKTSQGDLITKKFIIQ